MKSSTWSNIKWVITIIKSIFVLVFGIFLLYFLGWDWVNTKMPVSLYKQSWNGILILDSLAIYKQGFGILVNSKLYGFEFNNMFTSMPTNRFFL